MIVGVEDKSVTAEATIDVKKDTETDTPEEIAAPPASFAQLLRFADKYDYCLMIVGAFGGMVTGVTLPLFSILLGGLYNDFIGTTDAFKEGKHYAMLFGFVAIATLFGGFAQMACFTISSERITLKIRQRYLDAVLRQDITWFDTCKSGELASKIAENTVIIREGIGEKLGALFQFMTMFLAGFVIGFVYSWKLTLVICSIAPLLALGGFFMMKTMAEATSKGLGAYAAAGGIAEEAISMIRTVVSFGVERRVANRYRDKLTEAEIIGVKKSRAQGIGMGFTFGVYFLSYALAFWYGSILVKDSMNSAAVTYPPDPTVDAFCNAALLNFVVTPAQLTQYSCNVATVQTSDVTFTTAADICNCNACKCGCAHANANCVSGGDITAVFFAVIMGAFALGQASPSITALVNAKAAAGTILSVIERTPEIVSDSKEGKVLDSMNGKVTFSEVTFRYPLRQEVPVFTNFNLVIEAGQTVALVGGSGCGKSTAVQLLQRFYDPEAGSIFIDDKYNIKDINLDWFRNQIGLVGQEPVLFGTSIAQNIAYGANREVTMEEIEQAAKSANAWDFISEFPDKFETQVGAKGSSLSGGQKQRIAIARALIRNPAILLLDEATSALDNESERVVQRAIDELLKTKSMTTIVIAHRLSTVRNADKIVVLGNGGVLEQGPHDTLMKIPDGFYFALVTAATRSQETGDTEPDIGELVEREASYRDELRATESFRSQRSSKLEDDLKGTPAMEDDEIEEAEKTGCFGKKKKKKEELYKVPLSRIFTFSSQEKWLYVPAVIAAMANGLVMPVFAILFSGISTVYYEPTQELITSTVRQYALYFVGLGCGVAIAYFAQFTFFGIIAERMTTRVRYNLFSAVIRQDVAFFDEKENSVGAITSKLATDAALVKAVLTDRLGITVMNVTTLVSGLVIAFYYGWLLTVVLLGTLPLMGIAAMFQMAAMGGLAKEDEERTGVASQVLTEAIAGIRTVTSFNIRERLVNLYTELLNESQKLGIKKGITVGAGFGLSQGMMFAIYSIAFLFGSWLMDTHGYSFMQLMRVFFAIVMMGFGMGQTAAMAPDIAKAGMAVSNVFKIIDRISPIDATSEDGLRADAETCEDIKVQNVSFAYPSRPDVKVLKDFSVTIKPGTTVALVGQSGSGKSTIISLLERYYDPASGCITVHGIDSKKANVSYLREKLGLVGQEPELFDTTIAENICYGLPEGKIPTQEQIEQAAKISNAHNFIMELPNTYNTPVGRGGSALSGGQKQRIAIARAIIRDPEILLLDEATAALDNESERLVQQALDDLVEHRKRTTIVIAHRLTTIQNADVILAMDHGVLLESGTHAELLAKQGYYYKLWNAQSKKH